MTDQLLIAPSVDVTTTLEPEPIFDYFVLDDSLIESFLNTVLPIPNWVNSQVQLIHYLLGRWAELNAVAKPANRKLSFLPFSANAERVIPKTSAFGSTLPPLTNLGLDMAQYYPQNIIPIEGTPFSVCKYPARQYVRTYVDGKRGYREFGYCFLILESQQECANLEQ